jgi:L-lactate dehydrogenase complex protein LldG
MTASSRDEILGRLRQTTLPAVELPDVQDCPEWFHYEDLPQQFSQVLSSVGGQMVRVRSLDEINAELEKLPAYREARMIASLVPGIRKANVDLDNVSDPHQLEQVEFFIAPGDFGVAENAAVWVTDTAIRHRVLYFITQHLALVVPTPSLVSNLHQAYRQIPFDQPHFGLFISGPSKTADIEQSLVIGAHGARSLTVFLRDER